MNPAKKCSKWKMFISFLILLICTTSGFGQIQYLYKDSVSGIKQSIYIDRNKKSDYYNKITSFRFNQMENEMYLNSLKYLHVNRKKIKNWNVGGIAAKWIPLKYYNDSLYLYYPCDFYCFYRILINDSLLVDWNGEGPVANAIVNYRQTSQCNYQFTITGRYADSLVVNVVLINEKYGIAEFKHINGADTSSHLMVDAQNARMFPLIINRCDSYKQREMQFDKLDCNTLK